MKKKYKIYLKVNIMSLIFLAVSFISVTLAWFAYSGLAKVSTEVNIKAWLIELEKNGKSVSNDIVISLSEIYPGMENITEIIDIKNMGDSDAQLSYSIISARILNEYDYEIDETTTSEYVEDMLAHEFPFHINMNLSKNYILSHGEQSSFEVSVSWPLDSDHDALDSTWGQKAYQFNTNEEVQKSLDENYQIKPSIQIKISVTAEQYIESENSSDVDYDLGDTILFDVLDNKVCTEISSTCLETYVIDVNNKLGEDTVTLLPNPNISYLSGVYSDYDLLLTSITNDWTVSTRALAVGDILKVTSKDIVNSLLIRDGLSDSIIGNLTYNNRLDTELSKAISYNGYYRYINSKFNYLLSDNCYWTTSEYDVNNAFAIGKINETNSKIYNELKSNDCKVIPVIIANKENL